VRSLSSIPLLKILTDHIKLGPRICLGQQVRPSIFLLTAQFNWHSTHCVVRIPRDLVLHHPAPADFPIPWARLWLHASGRTPACIVGDGQRAQGDREDPPQVGSHDVRAGEIIAYLFVSRCWQSYGAT
jgi:hypothetical protein